MRFAFLGQAQMDVLSAGLQPAVCLRLEQGEVDRAGCFALSFPGKVELQPLKPVSGGEGGAHRLVVEFARARGAQSGCGLLPLVAKPARQAPVQQQGRLGVASEQQPDPGFGLENADREGIAAVQVVLEALPPLFRGPDRQRPQG